MTLQNHIENLEIQECRSILTHLFESYLDPAFGTLPTKEVNLLMLTALMEMKYIEAKPDLYDLVRKLKVTRSKARNLIYDHELRLYNTSQLDEMLKGFLKNPIMQKQGDLFVFEIESPLIIDHLRSKLKKLKFASDGSFSPSLVKISIEAYIAIIEEYLTPEERNTVKGALVAGGAPDGSFKGVLRGVLKKVGSKIASDAGEEMAEELGEYMSPIISGVVGGLTDRVRGLLAEAD